MKQLVAKLPFHYHDKWRNIVEQTKGRKEIVKFDQLVSFVKKEARKANDPTYGREALRLDQKPLTGKSQSQKSSVAYRSRGAFHTKASEVGENTEAASGDVGSEKSQPQTDTDSISSRPKANAFSKTCIFCTDQQHSLEHCKRMTALSFQERIDFLSHGLCSGCLRHGHQRKICRRKATCARCQRNHPTPCHIDGRDFYKSDSSKSEKSVEASGPTSECVNLTDRSGTFMGAGEGMCRMAIIPVRVKMKNGLKSVESCAFLDPGSSVSFCTESLVRQLGASGRKLKITLDTMGTPHTMDTYAVNGLEIFDLEMEVAIELPKVYTKDRMPVSRGHIPTRSGVSQWSHLQDIPLPQVNAEIGLLIGNNVPDVYTPVELRTGPSGSPHATKSRLGWILWNVVCDTDEQLDTVQQANPLVNRATVIAIQEVEELKQLDQLVRQSINLDFPERNIDARKEYSQEDKLFMQKVNESLDLVNGHYQINLPFKQVNVQLPDNRIYALKRLRNLERKLKGNQKFLNDYQNFMYNTLDQGYAERVPDNEIERGDGRVWYLPHHGVYHAKKPDKIRVVFDCAAVYEGVSLNNLLLQGPDLTNYLTDVLLRFRRERVAVRGDIEAMFHQVRVPKEDCDCLRFLWWPSGDLDQKPVPYRMVVHLYGAVSSPSCANAALRQTAEANAAHCEPDVVQAVQRNFYVDDCLVSVNTEEKAIQLVRDISCLCSKGGFHLTKWSSNNHAVLESVPVEERAKGVKQLNLDHDDLPNERALGIHWYVELDALGFKIVARDALPTRINILSIVSSVYDPLGFVAPYVLTAKSLLQDLCRLKVDWDQQITGSNLQKWNQWLNDLPRLEDVKLQRCYKPTCFSQISSCQLHNFSDASDIGYGMVSYIRFVDTEGRIHCSILMGKSRVTPLKKVTIPRMELTVATMSVRINQLIIKELDYHVDKVFFWTDSMSVLRYVNNEATRFHTFVANRVEIIREASSPSQWGYVETKTNPADHASRGLNVEKLLQNGNWMNGPDFLWKPEQEWPHSNMTTETVPADDPEFKRTVMVTLSRSVINSYVTFRHGQS